MGNVWLDQQENKEQFLQEIAEAALCDYMPKSHESNNKTADQWWMAFPGFNDIQVRLDSRPSLRQDESDNFWSGLVPQRKIWNPICVRCLVAMGGPNNSFTDLMKFFFERPIEQFKPINCNLYRIGINIDLPFLKQVKECWRLENVFCKEANLSFDQFGSIFENTIEYEAKFIFAEAIPTITMESNRLGS